MWGKLKEEARRRAEEEIAKQDEQSRRSKKWVEAHQTTQISAKLQGVDLRNGNLANANFKNADLRDANLSGASLYYANLSEAHLENSKLIFAWLSGPGYREKRGADLSMAVLKGADLRHAKLGYANLTKANLDKANLFRASMQNANLSHANLHGVNLTQAYLNDTNFSGAILSGANLQDTQIENTNFTCALLENVNLERAIYTEKTLWPEKFNPRGAGAILQKYIFLNGFQYFDPRDEHGESRQWQEHIEGEQIHKEYSTETQFHLTSGLSSDQYQKLRSFVLFSYVTEMKRLTAISCTGCTSFELNISEDQSLKLCFTTDYYNENGRIWKWKLIGLVDIIVGEKYHEEANDWVAKQWSSPLSSYSEDKAKKIFGDWLITFRPKYDKQIIEFFFTWPRPK